MLKLDPSALNLRTLRTLVRNHDLTDPTAWRDRLVIWTAAVVAGLFVVFFTLLTERASEWFRACVEWSPWLPLVLTPVGAMLVVWLTRRLAPGAAGSGIPQVISGLSPEMPADKLKGFVSLRVSAFKAFLGATALGVGFSTGREGPSVQIAAGVMLSFRALLSKGSRIRGQDLMLAGGAAGIAAAFNAPLAGVIFAIEELSRRFEQRASGVIVTAIVLAGLVSISVLGNFTYFGRIRIETLSGVLLLPAIVCALVSGVLGGVFSRLLVLSTNGTPDRFSAFRRAHPIWFAGACGLGIALLGAVSHGAAHGSGYFATRGMLSGETDLPFLYAGVKFIATWLSYWSGVPGGIFAPSLAVGAGLGRDVAVLMNADMTVLVAIGMVGFLAAATQAPITSFIIVMEMIDGHSMVLSLMATALIAGLISRLLSPPLYHSLSFLQLAALNLPPEAEKGAEGDPEPPSSISATP